AAANKAQTRSCAKGSPDARATSSPRVSIRSPDRARRAKNADMPSATATHITSNQLRLATEPSSQLITSAEATGDGERLKIKAVAAPEKLDKATPNRIRASGAFK